MPSRVFIDRILEICDPIAEPPWEGCAGRLDMDLVQECIDRGFLVDEEVDAGPASPEVHAGRIAWLVLNPAPDPIQIDVGVHASPGWIVIDGNHRLYAAVFRGDSHIDAEISGSLDRSLDLLGVAPDDDTPEGDVLVGYGGRIFEVMGNGRAVWINADDGGSVGRFSAFGVDVHADATAQIETGQHCLACSSSLSPQAGWALFRSSLRDHYGISVPEDLCPDFARQQDAPSP